MRNKKLDILKELQKLAKDDTHPYSSQFKIDDQKRIIWTNGFILIRVKIDANYSPGVYWARNMSPTGNNHYPKAEGFFEEKIGQDCPKIIEIAKTVKPVSSKISVPVSLQGEIMPKGDDCINLGYINLAVKLGVENCIYRKDKTFFLSSNSTDIEVILVSMREVEK